MGLGSVLTGAAGGALSGAGSALGGGSGGGGLIGGAMGALQPGPSQAYRLSSDYNPVISVNNVNSNGDLKSVADLISALNAGNAYNGSFADFGLNSAPINGGIQISTGVLGSTASASISPVVIIIAVIAAIFFLKRK